MVRFNRSASWSSVDARIVAEFCIEGGKDGIVYCAQSAQKEDPYEDDALFYKLDKQARVAIEKIENDQKLGRMSVAEADVARDKVKEKYVNIVKTKLRTLKCKMGDAVRRK